MFWAAMIPLTIIAQVVLASLRVAVTLPIGEMVALAGAVSTAFMGKRIAQEVKKNANDRPVYSNQETTEVYPPSQ